MDPWEWFLFLSGKYEGGQEHPSILLIICKSFPSRSTEFFEMKSGTFYAFMDQTTNIRSVVA